MRNQQGFTLIELMVVMVIVGVLASIALPAYQKTVQKGHRSGAEQLIMQIASQEQQYYLDARGYTIDLSSSALNIANNGWTCSSTGCTDNKFYTVTVSLVPGPPPSFIITGAPISGSNQVSDGTLYFNADTSGTYSQGAKTRTLGDSKW